MDNYIHSGCSSLRGQKCLLRNLKFGPHRFLTSQKTMKALFLWQFQSPNRLVFSVYILDSLKPPGIFSSQKRQERQPAKSHPRDLRVPVLRDVVAPRRCSENSVLAQSLVENLPGSQFFRGFSVAFFENTNLLKNSSFHFFGGKKWYPHFAVVCRCFGRPKNFKFELPNHTQQVALANLERIAEIHVLSQRYCLWKHSSTSW